MVAPQEKQSVVFLRSSVIITPFFAALFKLFVAAK
jgi:hypothetical protein